MPDPVTASCHISTCGDFLHRFRPLLGAVSDEHRLHLNEDGVFATTVDPANVMMIETSVDGDSLSDYAVDIQRTVGLELDKLKSVINYARKGRGKSEGDYVSIDVTDTKNLAITVMRDETNRKRVVPTMNTDAMRMEPDMPSLRDSYDWRCHVSVSEFKDAISAIDADHRHVQFAICDVDSGGVDDKLVGDLALYSHSGVEDSNQDLEDEFRFDNAAEAPADGSDPPVTLLSLDYLADIADAVKTATDDAKLLIEYGDEHPMFATVEVPEYGLETTYCLAPRMTDDGDRIKHPSWGSYP